MKKNIIKIGKSLMIPVLIIAIFSFIFKDQFNSYKYIQVVWFFIIIASILVVLSGIMEFIDNKKNKE